MQIFDRKLFDEVLKAHIGSEFEYTPYGSESKKKILVTSASKMKAAVADALGYNDVRAFSKVLSGKTFPRDEKISLLYELFGVSFIFRSRSESQKMEREDQEMNEMNAMNAIAKRALTQMYARSIRMYNQALEEFDERDVFEDRLTSLLSELEEYRLSVPQETYDAFIGQLRENYELPDVEKEDLMLPGSENVLRDEGAAKKLIARSLQRTLDAKRAFEESSLRAFAHLVQQ